ncbi:hypothetical protein BU16DRAFT_567335 [Lophium mytilinum]|uniref:Uncharacterized protein n=1 Tax=Lophium mytilinum TaxID=390894 RepID=A0A6A6QA88_9PEZI|nr:hypothetical protein BU16DRAFT_567335 [Lophium mytilinum]
MAERHECAAIEHFLPSSPTSTSLRGIKTFSFLALAPPLHSTPKHLPTLQPPDLVVVKPPSLSYIYSGSFYNYKQNPPQQPHQMDDYSTGYQMFGLCMTDEDHRLHGKEGRCSLSTLERARVDTRQAKEKHFLASRNPNIVSTDSIRNTAPKNGNNGRTVQNAIVDEGSADAPASASHTSAELEAAEGLLLLGDPVVHRQPHRLGVGNFTSSPIASSTRRRPTFQHYRGVPSNLISPSFHPSTNSNSFRSLDHGYFPPGYAILTPRPSTSSTPSFQSAPAAEPGRLPISHHAPYNGPVYPPQLPYPRRAPVPLPQSFHTPTYAAPVFPPRASLPPPASSTRPTIPPCQTSTTVPTPTNSQEGTLLHACPNCGKTYTGKDGLHYHVNKAKNRCTDPAGTTEQFKEARYKPN